MAHKHKFIRPANRGQVVKANIRAKYLQSQSVGLAADQFNFSNLNDVLYSGREDRMERYRIYDVMDRDVDIARALDMIAEHCTMKDKDTKSPFVFEFEEDVTEDDTDTLRTMLKQWIRINDWDNRIWRTIRNCIKYGDAFFIRDPQTYELQAVAARQVVGIYVNQDTNEIEAYYLRDLSFQYDFMITNAPIAGQPSVYGTYPGRTPETTKFDAIVPATHVVHISLAEGQWTGGNGQHDDIWPFGESFLEQVFKDYKQRSLLEDAALIHRVQRAPSRRVWYIDVGKMRPDKAEEQVRRFKNNLLLKRIPNQFGGTDAIDSVYNAVSQLEDFFLPQSSDGRGSKVENMDGQQWTNLDDLKYWTSKVLRGLRVPVSFMLGPEEGGAQYQDGRTGTAYIQEMQFSKFCERIQDLVDNVFDFEFKLYLKAHGIQIHSSEFDLKFTPPMNFDIYRDQELLSARLGNFTTLANIPFISKRMAMMEGLGWEMDKVLLNERLWNEENRPDAARQNAHQDDMAGLGGAAGFGGGMDFGGGADLSGDMDMSGGMDLGGDGSMDAGGGGMGPMPGAGAAPDAPAEAPALTGPGTESRSVRSKKSILAEEITGDEIKKADEVLADEPESGPNDRLLGRNDKNRRREPITLAHVRKMRIEKEKNRRELMKRLDLISRMYAGSDDGGMGGGF